MPNNITAPRVPLTDPRTGLIHREWYRFFLSLYELVLSGNSVSIADLQVGPPATDAVNTLDLLPQIDVGPLAAGIAEIEKAVQAAQLSPTTLDPTTLTRTLQAIQVAPPVEALAARVESLENLIQGLLSTPPIIPEVTMPSDFALDVARGLVSGMSAVNKFGAAPDGIQTTLTDIWGRANATPTQQIWLAPTTARLHNIVSTSASDDGSPVGVGAHTIRVTGLTSWSTAEVSEDITLNGTTNVSTVNSYVIINRMKVLTSGATSICVGTITATAVTDARVTAVILPGRGQTEQAIYGVPSTQTLYINNCTYSMNDGTATSRVDFELVVNENPDVQTTNYLIKNTVELTNTGANSFTRIFNPPFKIAGPAIVKMRGIGSAVDLDASGSFDGILITN